MLGQPFVNPVNFVFGALLGLVYYAKHSHHDFVIFAVLFAELVEDGDDDRPYCCDYSGDDQCPPAVHHSAALDFSSSQSRTAFGVSLPQT